MRRKILELILECAFLGGITAKKADFIEAKGEYEITGFVLSDKHGNVTIADKARVRWIKREEFQALMKDE